MAKSFIQIGGHCLRLDPFVAAILKVRLATIQYNTIQYNFISPSYMIHVKHRIQNIDACKKKSFGDNTDTHTKHTHTLLHT